MTTPRHTSLAAACAIAITLLFASPAFADDPDTAGMQRLFDGLQKAMADKNETAFKALLHPETYENNLVGGSGLNGKALYAQGSKQGWYLKADVDKLTSVKSGASAWIVPCAVWSIKENRAVDAVHVVVVYRGKGWVALGGGEDLEEVKARAKRYEAKAPLAPPKQK